MRKEGKERKCVFGVSIKRLEEGGSGMCWGLDWNTSGGKFAGNP